jgi:hypothetical protein
VNSLSPLARLGVVIGSVLGGVLILFALGLGAKAAWHEMTKERPHFNTGKIIQKDFNPSHYDSVPRQQYAGEDCTTDSRGTRSCTPHYITVYDQVFVPDDWNVQIQNCNVMHKNGTQWVNKDGTPKCFHKWVDVDQTTYNQSKIGAEYR